MAKRSSILRFLATVDAWIVFGVGVVVLFAVLFGVLR